MLADVIEHLEPDPYTFGGHYWSERAQEFQKPLQFRCEFTHDTQAIVADGPEGSFEMRIPFEGSPPRRPSVQLFIRGFGHTKGELTFSDGNALFVGRNEHATIFAHICFDERGAIAVVGTFESKGERILYSLNGSLDKGPASIANVRSLAKRA